MLGARRNTSAYLHDGRLADVIAAVTVLGAHRSSEKDVAGWANDLARPDEAQKGIATRHWQRVFEEHPEFFIVYRLTDDEQKAALRLRYANKTIDRGTQKIHEKLASLSPAERSRLTSLPLAADAVATLVSSAISLHAAALARNADARHWLALVGPVLSLLSGVLVAVLTANLAKQAAPSTPQKIELSFPAGVAATIGGRHVGTVPPPP